MRAEIKMKYQLARDLPEAWWLCIRELMSKYDNGDFIYPHYRIDSGSYAGSIRRHFGFVVVHIIYPGSRPLIPDIPPGLGIPAPSLRFIDTRVSNGKLHFFPYFRSWDLWGGFPSNLAGLQMMKEYMAAEIGVEDGEMVVASKGLHLYDYSWDLARIRAFGAPKVVRREGTETQ